MSELLAVIVCLLIAGAAHAEVKRGEIRLDVSGGELLQLPGDASSVFVADPNIADVQAPAPNRVFVFGKRPGRTSLFALGGPGNGPIASYQVIVSHPVGDLQNLLRKEVPEATLDVESTQSGLILSGLAPTPEIAERARSIAARYVAEPEILINRVRVAAPTQVQLRVRVAEVARSVSKELGFNWEALGAPGSFLLGLGTGRDIVNDTTGIFQRGANQVGSIFGGVRTSRLNLNVAIDALNQEGLVTILAEPNLTAVSGQTASFLAGGEFPIPVAQYQNTISIQFKQFGVSLDFVPTVLSADRISLKVRPEVSELTDQGAITLENIQVPALRVRRAETTIELGSGQSFAIAGLLQNNSQNLVSKYPGIGDIPILGTLFRSSRFQRDETELVIIVTPYIVRPAARAQALRLPTEGLAPASDLERIFLGRVARAGERPGSAEIGLGGRRLLGDAGFAGE